MFNPQQEKIRIFTRRSVVLTGAKYAMLASLGLRLYYLQVKESKKYRNLSEGNRIRLLPVIPRRGIIRDRNGKTIIEGLPRYQLIYTPPKDKEIALENFYRISELIKLPKNRHEEIIAQIKNPALRNKKRSGILIENFLSWENIAKMKLNSRELSGVEVSYAESRFYPYENFTCHITGYTSMANENDEKEAKISKELLFHPDFRLGRAGIELSKQDELMGKPGVKEIEVDARGNYIKDLGYTSHKKGKDLKLTIDVDLQIRFQSLLKGKGGTAGEAASGVLIDVDNGDILALASVPDYDPNAFIRGISTDELNALYKNPDKPFINKAISVGYPSGSTFKPFVAAAALHYGIITPNTRIYCGGQTYLGSRRFDCWKKEGHGSLNVQEALQHSCNVFFYEIAKLMSIEQISEFATKFGLGEKFDIDLPQTIKGLIPTRMWKWANYREAWYQGETLVTAIGQGYVQVTPLQLAVSAARIASGGRQVTPRLIIKDNQYERNFPMISGMDPQNLQVVMGGMAKVVNSYGGTAFASRIEDPAMMMAGKTGTAQVKAKVKHANRALEKKDDNTHALFIGYAPVYKPKYAVSVVVEFGGGGSKAAAPIAKQILEYAQSRRG
ncbi:MAG TPA: penicillin-binding protein 2 [Alphaproteobacteria bacterium]|nr:penicillin-binding protein 2 [Alphaproteobacteria bacterium]